MHNYKFVVINSNANYYNFFSENCNNYVVYINSMNKFKKIIFQLHNSCKFNKKRSLPFRKIWKKRIINKKIMSKLNENDYVCFVFSVYGDYPIKTGLIEYLRKKFTNSKFIFSFRDLISLYENNCNDFFSRYKNYIDVFTTYNVNDSKKYNIVLTPPKLIDFCYIPQKRIDNDVFFVGKNKNRIYEIQEIYDLLNSKGYKLKFYVTDVPKNCIRKHDKIKYNKKISYKKVLKNISSSKCILNLMQPDCKGITLRDNEAIFFNKIIITNNSLIKKMDFYTEDKVILLKNLKEECYKIDNYTQTIGWKQPKDCTLDKYYEFINNKLNEL